MSIILRVKNSRILLTFLALALVFALQFIIILIDPRYHDVLRHLYYLPIILGGYFLGPAGGVFFGVVSSIASSIHIILHSNVLIMDLALQLIIFCLTGGFIGYLSEGERKRRIMLEKSSMEFMKALSNSIDARDPYTKGHSLRVAGIARKIGMEMGLGERDLDLIYQAGLLHDIGKIAVPDNILKKPGKLSEEEYKVIKHHPSEGETILINVEMLKNLIPVVKSHHERYNGKGYPDKLREENIPLMARIIAVADAFDAMTSDRTYRVGRDIPSAVEEIEKNAGGQFDPQVVKAFKEVVRGFEIESGRGLVLDPVCMMEVIIGIAPAEYEYRNVRYYFCSSTCKEQFVMEPERYLKK